MSIIEKLASSLNRRDEIPNQDLASEIVMAEDEAAINELVVNLSNKKAIQNDCIKVLYEIGAQKPKLIAAYLQEFVGHLDSKNNRLQWGCMMALSAVTEEKPKEIYLSLKSILAAADNGSVITKDHAVNILIKLCAIEKYAEDAVNLLLEQLLKSPTNQLPMYAERIMPVVNSKNKLRFIKALEERMEEIEKESGRKRIEKVIRKISKL